MTRRPANRRPIVAASLAVLLVALCWLAYNAGKARVGDDAVVSAPSASAQGSERAAWAELEPAPAGTRTVRPTRNDEVLTNPGLGFPSFHFGWWCNLPPITYSPEECAERVRRHWPERYPDSATAYFRWHWRELEPVRGQIAFDVIDAAIQSANRLGMTLGFRVMTVEEGKSGLPDWLMSGPDAVGGDWFDGGAGKTFWPDYRDAVLQREHARLIEALAQRYDGHPAVDHIDIGTVGCWGEWNTACLSGVESIIEVYRPSSRKERRKITAAYERLIDDHLNAFSKTPVIMLALGADDVGLMVHATRGGAGWRADCWGDWGLWGGSWSHQTKLYPQMIEAATEAEPGFPDVWKRAPVHLEVCGTMERWHELGWTTSKPDGKVFATFQWALEHHASLLNAKSKPVPESYVPAIDTLLKKVGYRFVVDAVNHPRSVRAGEHIELKSLWSNLGVAPAYGPRTLTYRLRRGAKTITFPSEQDIRTWLPGRIRVDDAYAVPADLAAGTYTIELALLDRDGASPDTKALPPLRLGNEGRRPDGWYAISTLEVESDTPPKDSK
jgi:hypothetical protein